MRIYTIVLFLSYFTTLAAQSQDNSSELVNYPIYLDKSINLGSVTAFQSKDNPNQYYYLPNTVRVKTDPTNGVLQIGFQQYVQNERSVAEEKARDKGTGGGFFWMTVGYQLSTEELNQAQKQLNDIRPGARIIGSIAYESGSCTLQSFGTQKNESETTNIQILGVGNAPLMDGDAISVAMVLNAENATKLYNALKLPNPGIQMNFSMNFRGFSSPIAATVIMNLDQIYADKRISGAIQVPKMGFEIEKMTQEFIDKGAIKIDLVGNLSDKDQELIHQVTEQFRTYCFELNDQTELLTQGISTELSPMEKLNKYKKEYPQLKSPAQNIPVIINQSNPETGSSAKKKKHQEIVSAKILTQLYLKVDQKDAFEACKKQIDQKKYQEAAGCYETLFKRVNSKTDSAAALINAAISNIAYSQSIKEHSEKIPLFEKAMAQLYGVFKINSVQREMINLATTIITDFFGYAYDELHIEPESTSTAEKELDGPSEVQPENKPFESTPNMVVDQPTADVPLSIYSSYKIKKLSRKGSRTFNLNRVMPASRTREIALTMPRIPVSNIQQINLDDPLYTQREITAVLDGSVLNDFDKYINYITVSIRKKHPGGDISIVEELIDKSNFNTNNNQIKLLYGWKPGDQNRRTWLDYEYRTIWSYHGGNDIHADWLPSNRGTISLSSPYVRRVVDILGDIEKIKSQGIRNIQIKLTTTIGGKEKVNSVSIPVEQLPEISTSIYILQAQDNRNFKYEINWLYRGGVIKKSGPIITDVNIIYVDEIN